MVLTLNCPLALALYLLNSWGIVLLWDLFMMINWLLEYSKVMLWRLGLEGTEILGFVIAIVLMSCYQSRWKISFLLIISTDYYCLLLPKLNAR